MDGISSITADVGGLLAGQAEQIGNQPPGDLDAARDLAAKFESIFTSLLLKEVRQSGGEDGFFGGDSSDVFGGLFDLYMGEHIAKSTSLGIGDMVSKYIETQRSSHANKPVT